MELNFFIGDKTEENIEFAKRVVFEEDDILFLEDDANMWDVLVHIGTFKSRSQARKNWRKGVTIPFGFTDMLLGKKKHRACIWKPMDVREVDCIFDEAGEYPCTVTGTL